LAQALKSTGPVLAASHKTINAKFSPPIFSSEQAMELLRHSCVTSVTLFADGLWVLYAPISDSKHSLRTLKRRNPHLFTAKAKLSRSTKTKTTSKIPRRRVRRLPRTDSICGPKE